MFDLTEFDAPLEQMNGVHSEKDRIYWKLFDEISKRYPHSEVHKITHWPVYTKRILMTRYLAHYELFKLTINKPGSIVELGVSRGVSFFAFHKFLEIFCPTDTTKKIFGFDSFEGLKDFNDKDGNTLNDNDKNNDKKLGGWSAEKVEHEIFELCKLTNADNILARERSKLIKGRIQETADKFLAENPGLRINLLHFDLDLFEPTYYSLNKFWDLVVPGGVIIFDEYGLVPWGGEATAFDQFCREKNLNIELKKFNWCLTPTAYCIKQKF